MPALRAPLAVLAAAAVAVGYVGSVDPGQPGHYPGCPFLLVTGWYCPGCGTLRAVHALAHGDVATAVARNPLTVGAAAVLAWYWVRWVRHRAAGRPGLPAVRGSLGWGAIAAVLLFGVLRNVPALAVLAP